MGGEGEAGGMKSGSQGEREEQALMGTTVNAISERRSFDS
ncbi:hypothetical protein NOC27_294 [Nitrosococcus oceani AFC27]|nr:hypothetical protein NOC27_294 [Nitrosococcus oceani AFC27]